MLKQNLETQISTMKKRVSEATTEKSGLEDAKATAEEELSSTKKTLADDEKYLEDLKQSCSMKAQEWATRQKDAAGELAAIAKAKEVLESGVKVFLEVSSKTHSKNDEGFDKRSRVISILSKLEDHSYFFTQIKSEARAGGPFDKVKGLIESMITRLEKEAAEQVAGARKQFATELSALTSNIKQMETRLTGNVEQVSSDLIAEKAMQARVNRKNSAELKRIEDKMNHQEETAEKARGALRMVLDENKRAAAEETAELDKLFKAKIAKERRSAAEIARGAAKDLSAATQKMYADMAEVAENNAAANEASAAAISKYSAESQAAIAASRKDFNARLNTLTNTVAANHRKVEKGLEVLTGVIRKNAKEGEEDRKLIRDQNKAMGDDMQKKIVRAIQIGETRAKQVENEAKKNLSSTKQAMLVQITNTVEKYADMAFKTISGNHAKIADNYLSLKAYAVTASDNLSEYTRKGQGKNLSSLGDPLNSIAALSAVKPQKAEGISPNGELPLLFSTTKVKVANKVTKINGMVNEFVDTANTVR